MAGNASAPDQRTVVTSIRFTPDEHAKLKRIAHTERRSLANQLRYWLAEAEEKEAA